jgi:hypothetical protein
MDAGTYKMWAQVDTYAQVPESNETNNVLGPQKIDVIAKGVLSVQPVDSFYSSGRQGGPFNPSSKKYTLRNTGGSDITWGAWGLENWCTLSSARGTLAPNTSTDVTVSINSNANSLTRGTHTGTIHFNNFTNGEGSTSRQVILTVKEALIGPDLVETSVTNPPTAARPGSSFTVGDVTRNQGALGAGASVTRYYVSLDTTKGAGDSLLVGSRDVPPLSARSSYMGPPVEVLIPVATKLGTYYLLACANDTGSVKETTKQNNCIASSTTVQVTLPDYVEESVSALQKTARLGAWFKVEDTVSNKGAVESNKTSTTRYYLVSDLQTKTGGKWLLKGGRTVGPLGPGGTSIGKETEVYVPTKIPLGSYRLMACADDTNVIAETVEKNNCRISTGTIQITK